MTYKRYGKSDWRKLEKPDWIEHFKKRGIKQEILSFSGYVFPKVTDAAHFFAQNGIHDFSGIELAAITNLEEWNETNSEGFLANVYGVIFKHYKKDYYLEMKDLQMPAIHLLRIETNNYRGNLHICKGYELNSKGRIVRKISEPLYNIEISDNDWQEGIRLPLPHEYDFKIAELFGFYWGLGSLTKSLSNSNQLSLSGRDSLRDLLCKEVKPLMESVHNLKVWDLDRKSEKTINWHNRKVSLEGYALHKTSKALMSFLLNEHKFPPPYKKIHSPGRVRKDYLPKIPWNNETIDGFVLGLIKSRGSDETRPHEYGVREIITINGEGNYGEELDALLTTRGHGHYKYFRREEYWTIVLNREAVLYFRSLMKDHQFF